MFSIKILTISGLILTSIIACTNVNNKPDDDPLKNTKRLVKEGHVSLYENGAINIPNTKIMLIPPGPTAMNFALELSGMKAKKSLLRSLENARDAIYLVADGSRKSYTVAEGVIEKTDQVANDITHFSRKESKLLIYKAYPATTHIIGESFKFSKEMEKEIEKLALSIRNKSTKYGKSANERHGTYAVIAGLSADFSINSVSKSTKKLNADIARISNNFIKGYIAIPKKWKQQNNQNQTSPFKEGWQRSTEANSKMSKFYTNLIVDTSSSYSKNISQSLNKSKNALNDAPETGVGIAMLDSVRWLLQALLWDATISPISKLGFASVGYITSNAVIFPVIVVANESAAVTKIAVEAAVNNTKKTIDIIAPTFEAALASTYAVSAFTLKSVGGLALGGAGVVASTAVGVTDSFSALTIQTAGNIAGYSVEYIGVPLSTAGVILGGSTAGVVVGSTKTVAGSTLFISGETGAAATKTIGAVGAGSMVVGGVVASTAFGTSLGIYELSKAVVVPTGYQLGSGIVLGYSSMSHIAAHSILAAADASYLVLSLEGANWVVYTVKGNLGSGDELIPGTVLDLHQMQIEGEEFAVLPASQEEMKSVANKVQTDLPYEFED